MSLPKYRILLLAGTTALTAGLVGPAAAAPAATSVAPQVERVCAGPNQIRSDADGKQMRAEVTLCASTDGRTVWYDLSQTCATSNPVDPFWHDFPSCNMSSQTGDVSKGGKELAGGTNPTYAGPGTYSFTINMHVRGNHENVNIWADGTTTYTLDFTHAADSSGVRVSAVVANQGTTNIIVGNSGTQTAHNTVLSIGTRMGADTPAAQAIEAYAVDLTANPRDAMTVAAAKKKTQDFPDDIKKHTDDSQCVSSQEVTVCDLGDLGPGAYKTIRLKNISFLTDWHVSAMEDPEGDSGYVPRASN